MKGRLFLIPNTLGSSVINNVLPPYNREIVCGLKHFIVEDIRNARRFLSVLKLPYPIDSLEFYTLNEHSSQSEIADLINLFKDNDVGLISDAGVPGIADPGQDVVRLAHNKGIRVIPLVGPSSILLAMMASGMNGQNFAFVGYLPVKREARIERIKQLEKLSAKQTQIFIEAPYRNMALFQDILDTCHPNTRICVAADITLETEYIRTATREEWKKGPLPELNKRPVIWVMET